MIKSNKFLNKERYLKYLRKHDLNEISMKYQPNYVNVKTILSLNNNYFNYNISVIFYIFTLFNTLKVESEDRLSVIISSLWVYNNKTIRCFGVNDVISRIIIKYKLKKQMVDKIKAFKEQIIKYKYEKLTTSLHYLHLFNLEIANDFHEKKDIIFEYSVRMLIKIHLTEKLYEMYNEDKARLALIKTLYKFKMFEYIERININNIDHENIEIEKYDDDINETCFYNNKIIPFEESKNIINDESEMLSRGSYARVYKNKKGCTKLGLFNYYQDNTIDNELEKYSYIKSEYVLELLESSFNYNVKKKEFRQLYTLPCLDYTLFDMFETKTTMEFKLKIMKQILLALNDFKKQRIIHADIKPNNIMYNIKEDKIYIIDFGLSLFKGLEIVKLDHDWYNTPPEFLNDEHLYDYSIDIWYTGLTFMYILSDGKLFTLNPSWKNKIYKRR